MTGNRFVAISPAETTGGGRLTAGYGYHFLMPSKRAFVNFFFFSKHGRGFPYVRFFNSILQPAERRQGDIL
jgi:hypothetical protein